MTPEEQMLISAVRYALGRSTYIVGVTCDFVASVKNKLSKCCIAILIHDIYGELEIAHDLGRTLGDECDEREWIDLLNILKEMDCANGN